MPIVDTNVRGPVYHTETLPVGGSVGVGCLGEFYYILSMTGPVTIETELSGPLPHAVAQQGMRLPIGKSFQRIQIINTHNAPNTVNFVAGFGAFIDQS